MIVKYLVEPNTVTHYKQETFIEPGIYYRFLGQRPSDELKRRLGLRACSKGRDFLWLTVCEPWVKAFIDGQFIVQPPMREQPDWSMIGVEPSVVRGWQKKLLTELWNYLRAGLNYRRGWVAPLGAGKTLAGLLAGQFYEPGEVGVLASRYLHETWRSQAEEWGVNAPIISTYESCHRLPDSIKCLLIDECFTADTLVHTARGLRNIQDIRPGELVMSYNHDSNTLEFQKVLGVLCKKPTNAILKMRVAEEIIYATANHPFWDGERYAPLVHFKPQDICFCLPRVPEPTGSPKHSGEPEKEVLQHLVLSPMAYEGIPGTVSTNTERGIGQSPPENPISDLRGNIFLEKETSETYDGGAAGQIKGNLPSLGVKATCEGWEWYWPDESREVSTKSVANSTPTGTQLSCHDFATAKRKPEGAQLSEGGYSLPAVSDSHRSAGQLSQSPSTSGTGQTETAMLEPVRLDSILPTKPGDSWELVDSERVYCLSVENNHNFFIGKCGVLVHNCVALKNSETQRSQKALEVSKKCETVIGFTGIPTAGGGPPDFRWLRAIEPGCLPADEKCWQFKWGLDTKLQEVGPNKAYITTEWDTAGIARFISPFVNTVDISEIASELPEITHTVIECETPQQFEQIRAGAATTSGVHKRLAQVLQCTDGFIYNDDNRPIRIVSDKLRVVEEWVRGLGEPVILVSAWTEAIEQLAEIFRDEWPAVLTGSTSDPSNEISRFKSGQTRLMIANAGFSKGMNLQKVCRIIGFLSVSSKPDDYQQMLGRVARPGQKDGVQIYHFHCKGSMDARRLELVRKHGECSEQFIDKLLLEELDK